MESPQFPQFENFGDPSRYHDIPLFGADLPFDWMNTPVETTSECCYQDAATCPDCSAGMVRQGTCFTCPVCGWGGCN